MTDKIRQKQQKKELIINAAARVFARKGFKGTVMADIAAQAEIGKGTIYEYFETKEDLFFAVFEWFIQELARGSTVEASALSASVRERLEAFSNSTMEALTGMKDLFPLSMEFWAATVSAQGRERFLDTFRRTYRDFRRLIASMIREGVERGEFRPGLDPESVAAFLVGAWDGLLLQTWFDQSFDPAATARAFMSALMKGLALPQESKSSQRSQA